MKLTACAYWQMAEKCFGLLSYKFKIFFKFSRFFLIIALEVLLLFFKFFIYLFLAALCLHCSMGFSLVAESRGYSLVTSTGFSLLWLLWLPSSGSRHVGSLVASPRLQSTGSVVMAHRHSCSTVCGIFPDQGSNSRLLH